MNMICPHCGKDFNKTIESLGFEAVLWHLAVHSGEMAEKIKELEEEIEDLKRSSYIVQDYY
jgi:hypothetical protein